MFCILKTISISFLGWYTLPWLLVEAPRNVHNEWQIGLRSWAFLGTLTVCLSAFFLFAVTTAFCKLGERAVDGGREYKQQHWKLLLSTALLYLLVLVPVIEPIKLAFSRKTPTELIISLLITAVAAFTTLKKWRNKGRESVYGLQHGRLHLDAHVPMWMNMGYWKTDEKDDLLPKKLAEACRDLLNLVLTQAEFPRTLTKTTSRRLIDVGFGCGDQTIHLMSDKPLRRCDELWWDTKSHQVYFDHYIGITEDQSQWRYGQTRVSELRNQWTTSNNRSIALFCANAAKPKFWDEELRTTMNTTKSESQETWLLALDTAYHFSPSRWTLIDHARWNLDASFMAFDLCQSPNSTFLQKLLLRIMTTVMGAPWENFVTPEAYKQRLIDIGYPADAIKVVDISEHVFSPLAAFMNEQNNRLRAFGLGLGNFQAAKWLFKWWSSTGVVRGVVVVARHPDNLS